MARKGKMRRDGSLACPKCGCTSLSGQKKGFGLFKGMVGNALIPVIGLLAAGIGKNKMKIICMNCGHKWKM